MELHRIFKIAGVVFLPAILSDWLLSFLGAKAFFNESQSPPALIWFIAGVLSVTALVMNFLTTEIFAETGSQGSLLKTLWIVCVIYDGYTTLIGIANMVAGAGLFSIATMNLFDLARTFTPQGMLFVLVASTILVASPMMAYWLLKKSALLMSKP